jgi:hypothetical protein
MILTHYHHQEDAPWQNLSALTEVEALGVIAGLGDRSGTVYRRFKDPQKYLQQRRATENWVRQGFIEKSGKPNLAYPHYLVVGRSAWIEAGYNGQSRRVQLPISDFPTDQISFTYPDSMISYWLKSQTEQIFYRPEYHGQVFGLGEIGAIIEAFGVPDREWQTEATRKYDLFIEAQIWTTIQ